LTIYKLPECTPVPSLPEGAILALGNFDGVHLGHQRLFEKASEMKRQGIGKISCAWTFTSLAKDGDCPCLTDTKTKLSLFALYGLDYAVLENFEDIRCLSCADFVNSCLSEKLKAAGVVCGFNFRFGNGGAGDASLLSSLAEGAGIASCVVDPVTANGQTVSSTLIRERLLLGDAEGALSLLGHPFSISFPVAHGKELGRTIGIPTINQHFPAGHIVPRQGIYACSCYIGGEIYLCVANVGVRPTVSDSGSVNCETHIINYSGDLYGKEVQVEFYARLREEMKFDSLEALRRQIRIDIAECLDYFAETFG